MAASEATWRYRLILFCTLLLLTFVTAACIAPDSPNVLSSEGEAVAEGEIVGDVPDAGEEIPVEVEEADAATLATGEPAAEAAEDAAGDVTATPEGVAAVPEEGASAEEGLAAEIGFSNALVSATYFVNRNVENLNGDVIADVDDLIIDMETGRIIYVVVNYNEFLDLTDEDRPLPLSAFGWNQDLELVLRLPEDVLDDVEAVSDEWPAEAGEGWNSSALAYWQEAGFLSEQSPDSLAIRATEFIGLHAGEVGTELGVIEDLLLDLSQEEVAYLGIFTTEGFYSPDSVLLVPVAATELQVQAVGDQPPYGITLLATDPELLQSAPGIDRGLFNSVDFLDQNFTQELNAFWGEQGYEVGAAEESAEE